MIDLEVIEGTERRFRERTGERERTIDKIEHGPLAKVDSEARVKLRFERLKKSAMVATAFTPVEVSVLRADDKPGGGEKIEDIMLERIMGNSDLLGINFLSHGSAAARSVCRVRIRNEQKRLVGYGTGFMISPELLITNNHVLRSLDQAMNSQAEFNFQEDDENRPMQPLVFDLDPNRFFVTNRSLDYSIVAVRDNSSTTPLSNFGSLRLIEEQGKIILGESASIIQHPNGGTKQLALRENKIVDRLDDFLHYMTDTAPGSSGSAVFNDQWEVIALHHSGVPKRDDDGHILALDGTVWTEAMGDAKIAWKANEGVRVSRILADLKEQKLTPEQSKILEGIKAGPAAVKPEAKPALVIPAVKVPEPPEPKLAAPAIGRDGSATWTIPLTVRVQLGAPEPGVTPVRNAIVQDAVVSDKPAADRRSSTVTDTDNAELNSSLALLRETLSKKYYDADQDRADREAYYAELDKTQDPDAMFQALSELLTNTHTEPHAYKPSKFVYPVVDLLPNGKIGSVYSGIEFDPEEFIREDFRIEQERAARISEFVASEGAISSAKFNEELDLLEAQLPFNCEHVVCQSWFEKQEPMRGDLHHLFACESRCNSFRNNIPYFDFPDFGESIMEECGKQEEKERFEPAAGKGKVARATLYFLLRYPGMLNSVQTQYNNDSIRTLLKWHDDFPVAVHELHRNASIFALQGNRNPLIDFPKLSKKIDFRLGL